MTNDELLFQQWLTIEKGVSWERGQKYRDAFFAGLRYARASKPVIYADEKLLAKDWDRQEEDEAWGYLNTTWWNCECGYSMPNELSTCTKCGATRVV